MNNSCVEDITIVVCITMDILQLFHTILVHLSSLRDSMCYVTEDIVQYFLEKEPPPDRSRSRLEAGGELIMYFSK